MSETDAVHLTCMIETKSQRTSPSLHLLALGVILALELIGFVAIVWAAEVKGYHPSKLAAGRSLALFIPMIAVFLWLMRRQRYRGEIMIFTAAAFLFGFGLVMQYRLFSDPEYSSRGAQRGKAREEKAQTVRLLNVKTGYDDEKKRFMFGSAEAVPEELPAPARQAPARSFFEILASVNTFIPIAALLALMLGFIVFKNDRVLLWLQRRALMVGLATMIPFAVLVLGFSEEGKFLGQTTPWEPVKIVFLLSFAGILADSYRHLSRTRWGLPPFKYLVPFAAIAAMPVVPFFALSDFGQMLVFFGVYVMLYVVAVRKKAQLAYGLVLLVMLFGCFSLASKAKSGFGIPPRVYFRFYMWTHMWEPPPIDTWWWKRDFERYLKAKDLAIDSNDAREIKQRNSEAWADKVMQQSQGLFGIHDGGALGTGLGIGFPETVPISDSDFIYAAVAEETGLAGGLALLIALGVLVSSGIVVSLGANDMFTKLIAAGLTGFLALQSLVNIGGVLRLLPMTGITLPFVSHGGWSLITSFAMLGILLAISHRNAVAGSSSQLVEDPSRFVAVR